MAITKKDLIEIVADKTEFSKRDVQRILDESLNTIVYGLKEDVDRKVSISGFGTFTSKSKEERTRRNPVTGESVLVPASISATWKPTKQLKDILNDK